MTQPKRVFTDDDLKRVKAELAACRKMEWPFPDADALISRLEAAESLLNDMDPTIFYPSLSAKYDAWRKAAGMPRLGEICEHGSLKRSCLICELLVESDEQARLLGMSGDREMKLLGQLQAADKLAEAVKKRRFIETHDVPLEPTGELVDDALAAYEKVRNK